MAGELGTYIRRNMKKAKPAMWMPYELERYGSWSPGTIVARFLNDPESPGLKGYEIISASIVHVTDLRVEILVRQRALT